MRSIFYSLFISFIILINNISFATLCTLTTKDVKLQVNQILKEHVSYKKLNLELIERALRNFIGELDPNKTYFLESDIERWLYPSKGLKKKILDSFYKEDFSIFEEIHQEMIKAIKRRRKLDKKTKELSILQDVDIEEFKNISWALSQEELLERLNKIRSIQLESFEKFKEEPKEQFLKRIEKIKEKKELKIIEKDEKVRKNLILTYILKSFSSALDDHTSYFTPTEASQFLLEVQQRFFGIGALLKDNLNGFLVSRILENGPAEKGEKLKIKDLIIAVDKKPVIGMDVIEVVETIRGKKGSKILLTILRDNKKIEVPIIRGEVILEKYRMNSYLEPFANGTIGYIHLFSFYEDPNNSSFKDIKSKIEDFKKTNLKGLILDLRNNSGGLLSQAVKVSSLFISKGVVVSIKDSNGFIQHLRDIEGKISFNGPLIILTNKASASASEIVAQSLKDYKRAIIVGDEKTFGKGTFQTFTLNQEKQKINPKGEYKVTKGKYYSVSGKSPQLYGVIPHIEVPGILSSLEIGEEFLKFPLKNDSISENFKDDLSDVDPCHRKKISLFYKNNLQPILNTYTPFIPMLKENSEKRVKANKNYQNFLNDLKEKNFNSPTIESFNKMDLQLIESKNIMKDLIFLLEKQPIAN